MRTLGRGGVSKEPAKPLFKKSASDLERPQSIALGGAISLQGEVSVAFVAPSDNRPWVPPTTGRYVLEVIDAGGLVLHREPVRDATMPMHHGHAGESFRWSARIPYLESAMEVLVRDTWAAGDVRFTGMITVTDR